MNETFTSIYLICAGIVWTGIGLYIFYMIRRVYASHSRFSERNKEVRYFKELKNISSEGRFNKKIHSIMGANLGNPNFTVPYFAREVGCGEQELRSLVSKLKCQSPEEFIRSTRMNKAAFLLKYNFGAVEDVARQVGYKDEELFSRTFRGYFGVDPQAYISVRKKQHQSRQFS